MTTLQRGLPEVQRTYRLPFRRTRSIKESRTRSTHEDKGPGYRATRDTPSRGPGRRRPRIRFPASVLPRCQRRQQPIRTGSTQPSSSADVPATAPERTYTRRADRTPSVRTKPTATPRSRGHPQTAIRPEDLSCHSRTLFAQMPRFLAIHLHSRFALFISSAFPW